MVGYLPRVQARPYSSATQHQTPTAHRPSPTTHHPPENPSEQVHLTGTTACVPSVGASNQLLSEITAISARRTLFNAEKCIF